MAAVRALGAVLVAGVLGACSSTTTNGPSSDTGVEPEDTGAADTGSAPVDTGVTPTASGVGTACESSGSGFPPQRGTCASNQICLTEPLGFRDGYCSRTCTGSGGCPSDATCTSFQGYPICLLTCTSNDDCRRDAGYVCAPAGNGTSRRVCQTNDAPVGARPDGSACFTTAAGAHQLPALARTVFAGPNASVSDERVDSLVEGEGNIAVARTGGAVASSYIAIASGTAYMGVSHARDGRTWLRNGRVDDGALNSTSDPVLEFGRDGALYMTFIGIQRNSFGQVSESHVRCAVSRDGGATWTRPVQVEPTGFCMQGGICDKPWIISAPTPGRPEGESLYIGYLQQTRNAANLVVQRSDDAGQTWTTPVVAMAAGSLGATPVAPNLVQFSVDSTGALGAAWLGLALGAEGGSGRLGSMDNRVLFRRSADGGRTWQGLRVLSRGTDSPVYEQPPVAMEGDTVHVAYASGDNTGAWDIVLATSTDAGASWRYRKVNDDPETCASHAFPAMVMDPTTRDVHLIWMENRFGEGGVAYARCPANPATPCGRNEAVNDTPFRFTTSRNPMIWHGDYLGLAISPAGDLWATWSDTRNGSPHMYVAHGRAR